MTHKAKKVVIITEKIIAERAAKVIEQCGATGYTIVAAGGKGDRGMRSAGRNASVVDEFTNVKIEVIVADKKAAKLIAETVAEKYFNDYPGLTYLEDVEILRPQKF